MNIYIEASKVIKVVKEKRGLVKNLIFSSEFKNKKALYALVCECLKYQEVLRTLLDRTGLLKLEKCLRNDPELAMVLLYDHVLGKRVSGKFQVMLKKHKNLIHSQCELMKVKAGVTSLKQLIQNNTERKDVCLPKYVRVNTIKTNMENILKEFQSQGWHLVNCTKDSFMEVVKCLKLSIFTIDPHIPDLLVFSASTDFHTNKLYVSGEIILQDKASCFPAYLLSPSPGSYVIDCCAAPGNKTSHLASIMHNKGKIFAFDKDQKRLVTLQNMMKKFGATSVIAKCQDFLSVNPNDNTYRNVEYILVDPSCSGTGMINRSSQQRDEESVSEDRLRQLSKFQITILKHALRFPSVKRVVYSTCSIHDKENEQVVEEVLSAVKDHFQMSYLQPDWSERGVKGYAHAQFCLRMSHDSAMTNGFFVACFERKQSGSLDNDPAKAGKIVNEEAGLHTDHTFNTEVKLNGVVENKLRENSSEHKKKKKKSKSKERIKDMFEADIEKTETIAEHIHNNSCKKKSNKSKERTKTYETKLEDAGPENEQKYSKTATCKKKRKKSKDRSVEYKLKPETETGTGDNRVLPKSTGCKKKRKKSKEKVVEIETEHCVREGTEYTNIIPCKKKRKKSKDRL